jgi:hypothetical protein
LQSKDTEGRPEERMRCGLQHQMLVANNRPGDDEVQEGRLANQGK